MSVCVWCERAYMLQECNAVLWQPTLWLPRLVLTAASWWLPQTADLCVMGLIVCMSVFVSVYVYVIVTGHVCVRTHVCVLVCVCARARACERARWYSVRVCVCVAGCVSSVSARVCVVCVSVSACVCALLVCPWRWFAGACVSGV